jgi:DHA2 family multidrug resistance protein
MIMLGYFDLAQLTLEAGPVQLLPGLLLAGAGMSCMFGTMSASVMRTVPRPMLTAASGLYTLFRRIGGNLGYALVASQLAHRTAFHRARLLDHLTPYDPGPALALDNLTARLVGGGVAPGAAIDSALKMLSGTVNRHATMMAYNDVFWMMGMLFVVGLPFLIMLGGRTPRSAPAPAPRQPTPIGASRG